MLVLKRTSPASVSVVQSSAARSSDQVDVFWRSFVYAVGEVKWSPRMPPAAECLGSSGAVVRQFAGVQNRVLMVYSGHQEPHFSLGGKVER